MFVTRLRAREIQFCSSDGFFNKSIQPRATAVGRCFPKQLRCQTALGNLVHCFATSRRISVKSAQLKPTSGHFSIWFQFLELSGNVGRYKDMTQGNPQVTFILMLKSPSCPLHSREGGFVQNNQGSASGLSQKFGGTPCTTER